MVCVDKVKPGLRRALQSKETYYCTQPYRPQQNQGQRTLAGNPNNSGNCREFFQRPAALNLAGTGGLFLIRAYSGGIRYKKETEDLQAFLGSFQEMV